jgi:hypothetical protein
MTRLLGLTSVDVEHQLSVLSDGIPPLLYHAPHIVDQSAQDLLVGDYAFSSMLSLKLAALKRSSASM